MLVYYYLFIIIKFILPFWWTKNLIALFDFILRTSLNNVNCTSAMELLDRYTKDQNYRVNIYSMCVQTALVN